MTACVCPACGYAGDLVAFTNDAQARHFSRLMGQVPTELADAVLRYLTLFSPAKHKLTWPRARRLLEELLPDVQRGAIERKRRQWLAPSAVWLRAFENMHDQRANLQLPLKSHGYLYEVIVGLVEKVEASAEQSVEQRRRAGDRQVTSSPSTEITAAEKLERDVRHVCATILSRQREMERLQRPIRSIQDLADDERDRFPEVVIDAAVARLHADIAKAARMTSPSPEKAA